MSYKISKQMIKELILKEPNILKFVQAEFRECARGYYVEGKGMNELEEMADHKLEGLAIVKKIRNQLNFAGLWMLHKKIMEKK